MRKLLIAVYIIVFLSITCAVGCMELTDSNTDMELSKKLANLDLFYKDDTKTGNSFRLDCLEEFVRNYEKSNSIQPTINNKIFPITTQLEYNPSKTYSRIDSLKGLCIGKIMQLIRKDTKDGTEKDKYDIEKLKAMKYWYVPPSDSGDNLVIIAYNENGQMVGVREKYIPPDPSTGFFRYFDDLSIGELEQTFFEYPGFSQAMKNSTLQVILQKQGVNELYRTVSVETGDYRKSIHKTLTDVAKKGIYTNEIRFYFQKIVCGDIYDSKIICKLLDDIAFFFYIKAKELFEQKKELSKEDKDLQERIFRHQVKARLDGKFDPFFFLQETVEHFTKENGFSKGHPFYTRIIDHCFQQYPFCAAKILTNLTITIPSSRKSEIALAIVKSHNLLQQIIDEDPKILQDIVKFAGLIQDAKRLKLFLKYGVKPSFSIIHEAVKAGNEELLKLLAEYGADFGDSSFMDSALATNNLACIHFILNQQKNVLKQKPELYDSLVNLISDSDRSISKEYNLAYAKSVYKALLQALSSDTIQPLKDVILSFNYDMQKLNEIVKPALTTKKLSVVADVIHELSTHDVLLKQYPFILKNMLQHIKKFNKERRVIYRVNNLDPQQDFMWPVGGIGFSAFLLSRSCNDIETTDGIVVTGAELDSAFTKLGIGIFTLSIMALYPYFKEYYKKYSKAKEKVFLQTDYAYTKGRLRGLLGAQGEPEEDFSENCEWEILNKWDLNNILLFSVPFWFGFWPTLLCGPYLVSWPAAAGTLFYLFRLEAQERKIKDEREARTKEYLKKLLNYYFKCGQRDGYAKYAEIHQIQQEPKDEQVSAKKNPFRGFFGDIITSSRNLFAGLVSCLPKYQIRRN